MLGWSGVGLYRCCGELAQEPIPLSYIVVLVLVVVNKRTVDERVGKTCGKVIHRLSCLEIFNGEDAELLFCGYLRDYDNTLRRVR